MVSLLEYGAQAMAVHGCLLSRQAGMRMQKGYLAALRDVKLSEEYLSEVNEQLIIEAYQTYSENGNMMYNLSVHAGTRLLASGRATVIGTFVQEAEQ